MLRVKEQVTAELLTSRLKDVEINHLMLESGTTDSSNPDNDIHFASNTRQRITSQRVPMIHTGDLDALPKGHAFALLAGGSTSSGCRCLMMTRTCPRVCRAWSTA